MDASFVLAVVQNNPDALRFKEVLRRGIIVATAFGEIVYKLAQRANTPATSTGAFLKSQGVTVEPFIPAAALHLAELKALDARCVGDQEAANAAQIKSLSFGDLCCLAHAQERGIPVLTGDRHWTTLGGYGLAVAVYDFRDRSMST
ncbi:MAG: PIN domain-containing protein [Acidimicrobiales bacterium]